MEPLGMKTGKRLPLGIFLTLCLVLQLRAQNETPLYENNFEKAEVGRVPDDFLVLDGGFAVAKEGNNKFLELPGAPLDSFGVLFGPTEKENVAVAARILGTAKGRRYPTFAVGLNGSGGFKLQVSPAKKMLELYQGDLVKRSVPFEWISGTWTFLKLQVRKINSGQWKIEGKAWLEGHNEPGWEVSLNQSEEPTAGRAAIWGSPYATTPIRFDDLKVTRAR